MKIERYQLNHTHMMHFVDKMGKLITDEEVVCPNNTSAEDTTKSSTASEIYQLQNEVAELRTQNEHLTQSLLDQDALKNEHDCLRDEREALKLQVEELVAKLNAYEQGDDNCATALSFYEQQTTQRTIVLNPTCKIHHIVKKTVTSSDDDLKNSLEQLRDATEKPVSEFGTLSAKLAGLLSQNKELALSNASLKSRYSKLRKDMRTTELKSFDLTKVALGKLDDLRSDVRKLPPPSGCFAKFLKLHFLQAQQRIDNNIVEVERLITGKGR